MRRGLFSLLTILVIALFVGCSSSYDPMFGEPSINPNDTNNYDLSPIIAHDDISVLGLFGAYNLLVSPDEPTADLIPMRISALGESYLVSGLPFFTFTPCPDCLIVKGVALDNDSNIGLIFSIRHPFPKGNSSEEPSASNRLDLDVFDLALFISPLGVQASEFQLTQTDTTPTKIQGNCLLNADGYSKELEEFMNFPSALPFKICYERAAQNRFEMGTDWHDFTVFSLLRNGTWIYI